MPGQADLRLLRGRRRRDAGPDRQPAGPVGDRLPRRRPRALQGVAARAAVGGRPAGARRLGTREDADFTIALCDALAAMLDVLGFYQERIANENLPAHRDRAALDPRARPPDRLRAGARRGRRHATSPSRCRRSPGSAGAGGRARRRSPSARGCRACRARTSSRRPSRPSRRSSARAEWNAIPVQADVPWHPQFRDTQL